MGFVKYAYYADFKEFAESDPTTAELLCRKIGRDFEYSLNDAMVNDGRKWDIWNRQGMFVYPALKGFCSRTNSKQSILPRNIGTPT